MASVQNQTRRAQVAHQVEVASQLGQRLKGLLGRKTLEEGHGLWIKSCNSIHTFFMQFPIDVIFVSAQGKVLRTIESIKPNRITRVVFGASAVLELPAGTLQKIEVQKGDQLALEGNT